MNDTQANLTAMGIANPQQIKSYSLEQISDVTLTRAGRNSGAVVNFQAVAVTDFHSAIALRR